jgi:hypothetical protein
MFMNLPATNIPIPKLYRAHAGVLKTTATLFFCRAVFKIVDSHTQKQRREQYSKTITDGTDTDAD